MNFRSTIFAFALLLGMLWLFGLMLALHTGTLEKDLLLPTLYAAKDADIDQVTITRHDLGEADSFVFTKKDDKWRVRIPPVQRSAAVNNEIEDIIRDLREARENREVSVRNDAAYYGLQKPSLTITLRGKEKEGGPEREWQVFVGKKSPDEKGFIYVSSSERPGEILAVPEANLRKVFFTDVQHFRMHDLLETTEASLQWLRLADGKQAIELKKTGTDWQFVEPKLGYAEWQSPEATKLGSVEVAPDGVRAIATALSALRVERNDDFVPLSDDDLGRYGLAPKSEAMRIAISNDPKMKDKQVLLIGSRAAKNKDDRYYARFEGEDSIVLVDGGKLKPLFAALQDPQALRSKQLAHFEPKNVTRIEIRSGKDVVELRQPETDHWQVLLNSEQKPAAESAIKELFETLRGERQIKEFVDVAGAEAAKKDAELGLDQPAITVKLWTEAVSSDKEKKDSEKKDKLSVVIEFATAKGDVVHGKSTVDGVVTRFTVDKSVLDRIVPKSGALAFLDVGLPVFESEGVTAVTRRTPGQSVDIVKDKERWRIANTKDGPQFADSKRVAELLTIVNHLRASEWIKKIDEMTDLAAYGLKTPALEIAIRSGSKELRAADYAGITGLAVNVLSRPLLSAVSMSAQLAAAGGNEIAYAFGKAVDKDGTEVVYGMRRGSDLLFRLPAEEVQSMIDLDLRDRFWLSRFDPAVDASMIGIIAANGLLAGSPLLTHQVAMVDPTQVKEVRVAVRTEAELRRFHFVRKDDKTWQDKTGLEEFDVDAEQLNQLVQKFGQLRAASFVSFQGATWPEHKLTAKEATVQVELTTADSKSPVVITVGARADQGFYAQSSTWPGAVFIVPATEIESLQRGAAYFGKTKRAA